MTCSPARRSEVYGVKDGRLLGLASRVHFTGHVGEVREDDWGTVRVDTDGDGHADFKVYVIGAVHEHDLVLL